MIIAMPSKEKSVSTPTDQDEKRRLKSKLATQAAATNADPAGVNALPYYHGLVSRDEAESALRKNGDFVIRKTEHGNEMVLALIVKWNQDCKHYLIIRTDDDNGWYYIEPERTFDNVHDMVTWYKKMAQPVGGHKEGPYLKQPIDRPVWQLNREQITLHELLGAGAFGEVYRGVLQLTTQSGVTVAQPKSATRDPTLPGTTIECAVKMLNQTKANPSTRKQREAFVKEAEILREWRHPNIIELYGVCVQERPVLIVLEYAPNGALDKYLQANAGRLSTVQRAKFAHDVAKAMAFLEERQCIHRDIAARNCLLSKLLIVKMSDFGLSSLSRGGEEVRDTLPTRMPIKWLAPECLMTNTYSHKSDVWAFGILLWEIFSDGAHPYPGLDNQQTRERLVRENYRMDPPDDMPDAISELMDECWNVLPEMRPTFKEIKKTLNQAIVENENK